MTLSTWWQQGDVWQARREGADLDEGVIEDGNLPALDLVLGHVLQAPQVPATPITLQVQYHQGFDAPLQWHFRPLALGVTNLLMHTCLTCYDVLMNAVQTCPGVLTSTVNARL